MRIHEIEAHAGRTFNHPYEAYGNFRPGVTLKATLEEGDDPAGCAHILQNAAEAQVESLKKCILDSLETERTREHVRLKREELQGYVEYGETRLAGLRLKLQEAATSAAAKELEDTIASIEAEVAGYREQLAKLVMPPEPALRIA